VRDAFVPRLLIIAGDGSEREVELTERTIQIGRGPGNDIVLSDPNSGVSRTHAELRFRNGRCVVVDLQSQNGTFLNGERIEHAEIPLDGEVSVGTYRLRLLSGSARRAGEALDDGEPPSTVGFGRQVVVTPDAPLPDIPLVRSASTGSTTRRSVLSSGAAVAGAAVIVLAAALLAWVYTSGGRSTDAPTYPTPEVPAAAATPLPSRDLPAPADPAPVAAPATPVMPAPLTSSGRTSASVPPVMVTRYDGSQVTRRPGESADAWRARAQAFQTRYAYSRAALDRGDFAAAAGGFEAILREEPGYLDVPQLLVRARAGLRDVARDVYEAGVRLDAAGDWLGALQKFEQAGQIHPEVRGLPEAVRRVREKLRAAGEAAFGRARRFDETGRWADALKEYEKAVQWLPNDDPRWEMAQSRVEQLKRSLR
jgi:hypothetical protein